jgi:hypothetical protein
MLSTFEDLETGDVRSAIALNEAAARFQLGGICVGALRDRRIAGHLSRSRSRSGCGSRTPRNGRGQSNTQGQGQVHHTRGAGATHGGPGGVSQVRGAARREALMRLMIAAGK